jgi:hypothetical protein
LLPFARVRGARLFWSVVATALAYRLLVPKTVVATTGPIYVTEAVPWLCLAVADGAANVAGWLARLRDARAKERVTALVLGAYCTAFLAFYPVEIRSIYRGARARQRMRDELHDAHATRALVFGDALVAQDEYATWAYFTPNPWPDLRDDVLYLRIPRGPDGLRRAIALWRTRFADRPAFEFTPSVGGGLLRPLASVAREREANSSR